MTDPSDKRTRLPLDLTVVLLLIIALVAGTIGMSRRSRRAAAGNPAAPLAAAFERTILPEQIGYRELAPVALDARVFGLAARADGHVFVSLGHTLVQFAADGSEVRRIEADTAVRCLAADGDTLYLGCGDHVEILDLATATKVAWEGLGERAFITSIAAAAHVVMVGDAGTRRFVRFDREGNRMGELAVGDSKVMGPGADGPMGYFDVAAAPDGTFWITDAMNFRIRHVDADGRSIGQLGMGGSDVEHFGGCCNPVQVAVGLDGVVVTAEKKPDLVKVFMGDGRFGCVVAGPSAFANRTFLADIAVDAVGHVLVLDPKSRALRRFAPKRP